MPRGSNRGGERPGAGRRPGGFGTPEQRALALLAPRTGNERPVDGLHITPVQKSAVLMTARGKSYAQIARELEITEETLRRWRKSSWWAEEVSLAIQEISGNPRAALEPLTPKALAAAEKILDDYLSENRDTPSARAIIELIFGYDFGKPILRHQRQEASHITVQFVNRSDEEEDAGK